MREPGVHTCETGQQGIICVVRELGEERMAGLFNFTDGDREVSLCPGRRGEDMLNGETLDTGSVSIPARGFRWLRI